MKDNEIVMVPFVAHESAMNRMERTNKRLWVLIIVLIVSIFAYLFLPTEVEETTTQDISEIQNSEVHQSIGD